MSTVTYKTSSKVWIYPGKAAWYFVTLPQALGQEIRELFGGMSRGFGSIPVEVCIGTTSWKTSIFPDKKSDSYLLPLKSDVRKKEGIKNNSVVDLEIKILV